jgi:hypothetical protein
MTDIALLLEEREKTHGSFMAHATATQQIKQVIAAWRHTDLLPEHAEALDMIAHKMGRILTGDPMFPDHWDDIAGYAVLGSRACKDVPNEPEIG